MARQRESTANGTAANGLMYSAFGDPDTRLYRWVSNFLVVVIFYSIGTIAAESVVSLRLRYEMFFRISEYVVVAVFTLEYIANIYVAKKKWAYVFGPWGIIDLLAIAPSLVQIVDIGGLRQLKVARIVRIVRVLRVMRVLKLAKRISGGYQRVKEQKYGTLKLDLEIYGLALFSVVVISSTLVHLAENFNRTSATFADIPTAMWWAIVTMTTVGYGDLVPVTVLGRIIAAATSLAGLALFAMLMTVLGKAMLLGLFGGGESGKSGSDSDEPAAAADASIPKVIRDLADLRDSGVLSEEEFQHKKHELLSRL